MTIDRQNSVGVGAIGLMLLWSPGSGAADSERLKAFGALPSFNEPAARLLFCGDGEPDPGEECDDGNQVSGDGCSAFCTVEPSIECWPQPPPPSNVNILTDGSFEDGNAQGEWTSISHSLFGPDLICSEESCYNQAFAAELDGSLIPGRYVLVAGGSFSGTSTGLVVHAPVAIPEDALTLEFQWATLASGPAGQACAGATDGLSLFIDGTQVWASTDDGPCTNINPYQRVVIDLATAPGGPYQGTTVGFEFHASATGLPPNVDLTNIMLDDVSINLPPDTDPPLHDCELDGVPDVSDNCWLTPNAAQRDADEDGHGNRCDADFNQDCIVNAIDLGILRDVFFTDNANVDLDSDGVVNVTDLGIFRSLFFTQPGPSAPGGLCGP